MEIDYEIQAGRKFPTDEHLQEEREKWEKEKKAFKPLE